MFDVLYVVLVLLAIGIIVWAADHYLPAAQPFKGIAIFLVVVFGVIFLLWRLPVMFGTGPGPHRTTAVRC